MTSESLEFRLILDKFYRIVDALKEYKGHYNKKFNFSKLMKLLEIPKTKIEDFISLIILFQDLFNIIFKEHYLETRKINNQFYITTRKKEANKIIHNDESHPIQGIQRNIKITHKYTQLLSDLIYIFKFIERGKGFDLKNQNSEFLIEIKKLKEMYPLLFIENGNNLSYPSELAIKLGELLISHEIGNKKLNHVEITYNFEFD